MAKGDARGLAPQAKYAARDRGQDPVLQGRQPAEVRLGAGGRRDRPDGRRAGHGRRHRAATAGSSPPGKTKKEGSSHGHVGGWWLGRRLTSEIERHADDRHPAGAADHLHDHAAAVAHHDRRPGRAADRGHAGQVGEQHPDRAGAGGRRQPTPSTSSRSPRTSWTRSCTRSTMPARPSCCSSSRARTGSTRTSSRPWTWPGAPGSRSSASRRRKRTGRAVRHEDVRRQEGRKESVRALRAFCAPASPP